MTLLKRLRKYRRTVAGALLPVLAFVWIGAAASPCVAMPTGPSEAAGLKGAPALASGAMATMSASLPSAEHADEHGSSEPHRPCPHCPPTQGHTAPHVACATLSAFLSANETLAAPAYDLGHALLPVVEVVPLDEPTCRTESRQRPPDRAPCRSPSVPLNLRYCVFLN